MDPIILSVGEEDEVSITDAVNAVVKAMEFKVRIWVKLCIISPRKNIFVLTLLNKLDHK